MNTDSLNFEDLELILIKVTGPKPNKTKYVLAEACAESVAKFNSARAKCLRFQDGGVAGVEGQGDMEIYLVSLCLFKPTEESAQTDNWIPDQTQSVSLTRLREWPGRMVSALYNRAIEISEIDLEDDIDKLLKQREDLDKKIKEIQEKERVKNELSDTETGSS